MIVVPMGFARGSYNTGRAPELVATSTRHADAAVQRPVRRTGRHGGQRFLERMERRFAHRRPLTRNEIAYRIASERKRGKR